MNRRPLPLVAAACLTALALSACSDTADPKQTAVAKPKQGKPRHEIAYKAVGTATKADITYSTPAGQEQGEATSVLLPWTKTIVVETGEFVGLSVSNLGAKGTVTCQIYVDGKLVKQSKNSGDHSSVNCDHTVHS
ncbi:MmpS family transport accessory protein [Actinomadura atramentaria]|uniref:MmpS family transport accessory protein n=1 Tax=Actinomadura atramentaria TaxID=1990 RepID=UPI000379E589|nr:MmpS family transport accessory protein [Actinomadura atramentaria]